MKLLLIFLTIASLQAFVSSLRVVCYFESWAVYRPDKGKFNVSNIDPHLCTHIHYGFVGLEESGKLQILDDWEANGMFELQHLLALKEVNPDLKLVVSMGGWNEGSEKYSRVSASPEKRKVLVDTAVEFIEQYKFDGFDLDWEYPYQRGGQEEDVENFIVLLGELKDVLTPKGWSLSIAVSGGIASANRSTDFEKIHKVVDWIDVMAYDYHGAFEPFIGHYAPLNASHLDVTEEQKGLNVYRGFSYWIERGVPAEKLNLGIGTYGRGFTVADTKNTSLYAPTWGPCQAGPYTGSGGTVGYNEICELYTDWEYVWDDEQQVPHIIKGNQWIGYDDIRSVQLKVKFAKSVGAGGIMIWALGTDDFLGNCGKVTSIDTIIKN